MMRSFRLQAVGLEQVQPDFADRGERRHRVPQLVDGHAPADGDRRRMEQFLQSRPGEGGAGDGPPLVVDDQLAGAADAVALGVRAGNLAGRRAHHGDPRPAARACAAVNPTAHTCGSVNVTRGTTASEAASATSWPRMAAAAMRPWYLPMWVSGASPLQSPIAYSQPPGASAAPSVRSTRTGLPGSSPRSTVAGLRPTATRISSPLNSRPSATWATTGPSRPSRRAAVIRT